MRIAAGRVALLITLFGAPVSHAQSVPVTLDHLVNSDRQKQLGLDKLGPGQRAGIVQLLQEFYELGRQEAQKKPASRQPLQGTAPTPSAIETQIDGDFEGWEGETIIKLMNGQIWQQTEFYYHYHYAFMPAVVVYSSGGGYKMKVDGVDRPVGVVRLR